MRLTSVSILTLHVGARDFNKADIANSFLTIANMHIHLSKICKYKPIFPTEIDGTIDADV